MLSEQQKLQFLQTTDLFALVPKEGLTAICRIAQDRKYLAGQLLFREGDKGDSLYLIINGEVEILKGDVQVMTLNQSGTCIGEMALIEENEPRSATIKTTKKTQLLQIYRNDLFQAMNQEFSIAQGMFRVLNDKIRRDLSVQMSAIRKEIARQESMRMAAEVQQSLLPDEEIRHSRLTTAGYCQPADAVGGDYYDYIQLPEGRFAIFLGDVMGHSYHSAMLMAMTKSCLHTQIGFDSSIHGVMHAINRIAGYHIRTWIYLTCCYVIINPVNQKLTFANAGHPSMLLYRAATREIVELASQFLPLGLLPAEEKDTIYQGKAVEWQPGDILVLYSDGITEAMDAADELYGEERLKAMISASAGLTPSEIKAAILADLNTFLQGQSAEDDITLVVAKWDKSSS